MNTQIQGNKAQTSFLSQDKIDLIKKQFFPQNASTLEMQYCFSVAEQYNLDPILKQIYFVPRRALDEKGKWVEKIEPLVGRDGFLAIAHKTGKFGGIKSYSEIKDTPVLVNGLWQNKKDLVAICEVYRNDAAKPFIVEVTYSEYVQTKADGTPTKIWSDKPDTMLKKVAESQALRKAFNLAGLYSPEEMGVGVVNNNDIVIDTQAVQNTVDVEVENRNILDDETKALEALGLSLEHKDGFIKIVGNTYSLTEQIKALGYRFQAEKKCWYKKIA